MPSAAIHRRPGDSSPGSRRTESGESREPGDYRVTWPPMIWIGGTQGAGKATPSSQPAFC
jgi:hypothetical protein